MMPDVQKAVAKATDAGGKELKAVATVEFPATQVPDQDAQEVNTEVKAVVTDPDGYKVTFIQGESKDVLSSVTLRVFDTEKAVAFYNKLGMKVLKKRANVPAETSISTWVGYDDDHIYTMGFVHEKLKQPQFHMMRVPATALLLNYEYDSQPVKTGNSLAQIVVGTNKGVKTALDSIAAEGAKVLKEVSTEDGQDVAAVADMDGYTLTLVDMEERGGERGRDGRRGNSAEMPVNFGSDKNLDWKNLGLAVLRGMRAWSEMLSLCVIYMKAMKCRHVFVIV
ncbi:lactoylglutathione chloroplast [Nannochloropsis gaditana]|uniref:Lactoylglutathione chloroplast n=1 Tax=Nannochloropsis gaditana TaxID=72520 RepID=W7T0G0_9STRA|nr:lactoylglutathione chloroplast [Nannochloropsis gaditana]